MRGNSWIWWPVRRLRVAGAVDALVVVAHDAQRQRRHVGRAQQLDAGVRVGLHQPELLGGQAAGLVEHLRRDRELADVVHEQPEAELAHAVVDAVHAAAAAVVGPAVGPPGAAGDQQPEHRHLDAVAVRVVVEGAEVVQRQRRLGAVEQVLDHRGGHVGERLDHGVRHARAVAQRAVGGADGLGRDALWTFARVSGVSGSAMSMSAPRSSSIQTEPTPAFGSSVA